MKLREYKNRFKDFNLVGAVLNLEGYSGHILKFYSGGMVWLVDKKTYPSGLVKFVTISPEELLNTEVLGWMDFKSPLMEGDYILLENWRKEKVVVVKEGDASPYPIVTEKGQYLWSEIAMGVKEL